MLHILICNLSTPCPCRCLVRKPSSLLESVIFIQSKQTVDESDITHTAIFALQCGECSYLQNAAGADVGKVRRAQLLAARGL